MASEFGSENAKSTVTPDSGSGWHSGINSGVFLAAMIPAKRATSSTFPLASFRSRMRARVVGCMVTTADAVAERCVSGFAPTSTMREAPAASKWLSFESIWSG